MNDKSIWYREVLEIEPQSRLFYPLARTLAHEGSLAEARNVLERGLSYHVHFVQARMLLCEVLQKLGAREEAEKQFSLVAGELEGTASFWQAFARASAKNRDESLVRRLTALELRNVPVEFSDILRRGLDNLEKEYGLEEHHSRSTVQAGASEAKPAAEVCREACAAPAASRADQNRAPADAGKKEVQAVPERQAAPEMRETAEPSFAQTAIFTAEPVVPHTISYSVMNPIQQAAHQVAHEASRQTVLRNEPQDAGLQEAKPDAGHGSMQAPMQGSVQAPVSEEVRSEEEMQCWPPRTRSMAEVFVEQGEYAEAVSIYHDLIRAQAGQDTAELTKRLAEIEAMAGREHGSAQEPALVLEESSDGPGNVTINASLNSAMKPVQDAQAEPAARSASDDLLGMLEKLAGRVEARVRQV